MKKVYFKILTIVLVALIGVFSITSCEKEDGNDKSPAGSSDTNTDSTSGEITGKWKHYRFTTNGTTTLHESECFDSHGSDYIEFKTDGTVYNQIYSKFNDSCIFNGDEYGTWEKSDNQLTLSLSGDTGTYQITKLNSTTLEVFITGSDGGTAYEGTQEFKRW